MSKFNDDGEELETPIAPQRSKAKDKGFVEKAVSTRTRAAEDPTMESALAPKAVKARKKKEVKMVQVSLKLHPDIIKTVNALANAERKMPAEVLRDLVLQGLKNEGANLLTALPHEKNETTTAN